MKRDHRRTLGGLVVIITLALGQSAGAVIFTLDLSAQTPAQIANAIVGAGVTISNVTYKGAVNAAGTFTDGDAAIGFPSGVVLSTGDIANVIGPNLEEGKTTDLDLPGDPDLSALAGFDTSDATVLEFDFVPNSSQVAFNYVFASDEYNEYVDTEFNDVFAFFINGVNCATVPLMPGVPVSVNTINGGTNALFYVNNDLASGAVYNTEMDGFTVVLTCRATVIPNVTNHIKLAIADSSDHILDSNVFIQASGITTNPGPSITSQPASQTIASGATATMSVVATGTGLTYQWYLGPSGITASPIAAATSNSYTTPALISNTRYWVRVSNSSGSTDSSTATITVAFTDSSLSAGTTLIRAVHITELRNRINAIRLARSLGTVTWPAMTAGVTLIRATDILQMRQALLEAYNAAARTPPSYTTTPGLGVLVVVADIAELRAAVLAIE